MQKSNGSGSVVLNIAWWILVEVVVVYSSLMRTLPLFLPIFDGFFILKLVWSCSSSHKLSNGSKLVL